MKDDQDKNRRVDELRGCLKWAEDRLWDMIDDLQGKDVFEADAVVERLLKVAKKLNNVR